MPVTLLMLQGVSCCVSHDRDLRLRGEGLHGGERTWGRETPVEQGGLACPCGGGDAGGAVRLEPCSAEACPGSLAAKQWAEAALRRSGEPCTSERDVQLPPASPAPPFQEVFYL